MTVLHTTFALYSKHTIGSDVTAWRADSGKTSKSVGEKKRFESPDVVLLLLFYFVLTERATSKLEGNSASIIVC